MSWAVYEISLQNQWAYDAVDKKSVLLVEET
jgi:hypothetical protein